MDRLALTDTLRGRTGESRIALWLFLDANRWLIGGLLSVLTFAVLVAFGAAAPPLGEMMGNADPVETAFQALIGSLITGVTLVVSINQLVLSQEIGQLGDHHQWMDEAMEFRQEVELLFGSIGPPDPAQFLQALVQTSADRAEALREAVADNDDEELRARTDRLVGNVVENSEEIYEQLETAEFGEFSVLRSGLNYNYSWKIYAVRRLRDEHADSLEEEDFEAFEDLVEILTLFGPALEHFKSLYFQWELVNLTRSILYAAIPALIVSLGTVLYLDPGSFPGATGGIDDVVWVVSASTALGLVPFFVLAAYVVRIATVSKRTGALGPFILRSSERTTAIDWEQ
ncbi:hypothetical protein [Halalkalicoccus jeotgali]|uniref:Uncharacterized protein n=1 Tax=Halalkalicoccus jeotgali (strain DSM 18796 / CECT 7217 / JCM 14584 / KCTC 4019 / B3) TaxID=795797 RepID=D8J7M8_HALJB|nr:hypothetical protein [Halalkalicoccus jeotgali]ADJ16048.1 hypothetical protein HacjB3_13335 [Halalkalicoccus jeotgali B3]ELY38144.1 hypothetical protein C497_08539 [Halalkalicoccus jeotgali B3]